MKNINKNAVHAIELSKGSYLAHKSIGDFTMGKMEFTIEISFICNDVSDCLLYAQEQGFQFGIRNGLLYFEQEGVGRITQKEEVVIEPNILYFVAASCKENVLSLYLEGLPIADKIDVKTEAAANDGNYVIGKGLNGYIAELRLRSCGMEDREILKDNGNGLEECESVEFWGDFSTVQYKDKSPNALPLWTNEGMVTCVNVASCTKISANGGFITMAKNSYTSGYTLLFKMFPQIEADNKMYVYSLTTEEDTAFAIGLDSDDNGDKYIFVEHNGEVFSNKSILPIGSWVDVGLCIEEAEARLYVDGIKQLTFVFNGELNQTRAFIGIEPFQNKVSYDNSFFGYLDYFAEFECVLDEDNIIFYSEEQPYVFDNSIRTLYSFYCGEPIDLKSGNTVLKVGESRALFEKGLNPLSAPIGMDLRVPTKVCDEWGKLSEEEQWATTTAMNIVREVYAGSVGLIPAAGNLPIEQAATTQIRLSYESVINEVKKVWKVADGKHEIADIIGASLRKGIGGLAAAVSGALKTATIMFSEKAMEILAGILIVGGTALAIGEAAYLIYKACNQDRPENKKGVLKLISICCNHQGKPQSGSIHFHSDADLTLPENMTYKNPSVDGSSGRMSMDMLIIPRLLEDRKVKATVRVKNMSKKEYRGKLKVICNGIFKETDRDIVIASGNEMNVDLLLQLLVGDNDSEKYVDEIFQFYYTEQGQDFFMQKCNVAVYMQSELPIEPWKTEVGTDYVRANKEYPSLVFIKNMIFSSKNRVTDIDDIMNTLFDSNKLRYNYNEKFTSNYNMFKLIKFNNVIKDNNSVEVNCVDCANIVSLIAAEIGEKMKLKMICGYNDFYKGFDLNPIISMGNGAAWNTEIEFSYHMIAFTSELEGFAFSENSKIYDLTLKIDKGEYPSRSDGNKEPFLSGGYKAFENDGFIVKMEEPYHVASYLERLIKQGQNAVYSAQGESTELLFEEKVVQTNELYTTFMQQYIKNYGLDNVKYSCEMKQKKLQLDSLEKAKLELQDKQIYESIWSTPDGSKITWYHNREHLSAGKYLASVLMRYSCRFSEKQAPELGERVFVAHELLITYFNGNAFAIRSNSIEKAEKIAIMLQKEYTGI